MPRFKNDVIKLKKVMGIKIIPKYPNLKNKSCVLYCLENVDSEKNTNQINIDKARIINDLFTCEALFFA